MLAHLIPLSFALFALSGLAVLLSEQGNALGLVPALDGIATLSAVTPISTALRRRRGRPRKFTAPSRAVTLTLPETVIEVLSKVDSDLSRAVVSLTKRRLTTNGRQPAELAVFGRRAVISIRPTPSLEKRTGIHLVPLPDGRALISFDQPKTIAEFELLLNDALDDPDLEAADRKVFEGISDILREARRSRDVKLLNKSIIVLESSDKRPRATVKAAARG